MRQYLFNTLFILVLGFSFSALAKPAPDSFADLAEALLPTVVNISASHKLEVADAPGSELPQFPEGSPFQDFFDEFLNQRRNMMPSIPQSSLGSGFVIDAENGYIVTNNHVIRGGTGIRVTFHNDVTVDAEVVGHDDKTDIAVIKIDPSEVKGLVAAKFGNSDELRVGDWVVAIGNPFGLGGTVTAGIISARQRDINSGPYDDFLQTDASINRGNSGGPMFDTDGEVIGINTAIFSPTGGSVGIGFAIPSALAKPVVDQLIKYGRTRRGWLGVRIQKVTDEIAESLGMKKAYGALVASPTEDSPGARAGIKAGDVITAFDGKVIDEMKDLPRIVAETEIGKKVPVTVLRNGKEKTITVTLGELEQAEESGLLSDDFQNLDDAPAGTDSDVEFDELGFSLSKLTPALRSRYEIDSSLKGVIVTDIAPTSPLYAKGIIAGDVIIEANQQTVSDPKDVKDIFDKVRKSDRKSVLLLVNSGGSVSFAAIRLDDE